MKFPLLLGGVVLAISAVSAQAQTFTFSGNKSTGFGNQIGGSTLTVTDTTSGVITFSLATPNAINDVAFFLSTGATGITSTSSLTDTGDGGRRAISGVSTDTDTNGNNLRSLVTFAPGFQAPYAIAIDGAGDANLFSTTSPAGSPGVLTYVSTLGETVTAGTGSTETYVFSLNSSAIGLTGNAPFRFVATLGNGSSGSNDTKNDDYYRSNETIGASNADNNAVGNLGSTGALTYTGFGTVPEPSTWMAMVTGASLLGGAFAVRRQRQRAASAN